MINKGHINEFLVGHNIMAENFKINEWQELKVFYREKYDPNIN